LLSFYYFLFSFFGILFWITGKGKSLHKAAGDLINGDLGIIENKLPSACGVFPLYSFIEIEISAITGEAIEIKAG